MGHYARECKATQSEIQWVAEIYNIGFPLMYAGKTAPADMDWDEVFTTGLNEKERRVREVMAQEQERRAQEIQMQQMRQMQMQQRPALPSAPQTQMQQPQMVMPPQVQMQQQQGQAPLGDFPQGSA